MTTTNTLITKAGIAAAVAALALILGIAQPARASEVTGTLSVGAAATTSTTTSDTISGTVVSGGSGGGGSSSRGRSGGNGRLLDDNGEVLGASTEPDFGMGGGGDVPGVPDAGAGGNAPYTVALLASSLVAFLAGAAFLARRRIA